MPGIDEKIIIDLETRYKGKGTEDLRKDIRRLQTYGIQEQYRKQAFPGTEAGERRRELALKKLELQEREKSAARLQRANLFTGLSIMFFGMAVARAFSGLLTPAADIAGIMELISLILTLLFLPVMLAILPHLVSLLGFVAGLSEEVKMAIGVISLLVFAVASLASWLAMISLGWGGIAQVLAGVTGAAGTVAAVLSSPLLAALLAIVAVFGAMILITKAFEDAMREVNIAIGQAIASILSLLPKEVLAPVGEVAKGAGEAFWGTADFIAKELPGGDIAASLWENEFNPARIMFEATAGGLNAITLNITNSPGVQTDSVSQTTEPGVSEVPVNEG